MTEQDKYANEMLYQAEQAAYRCFKPIGFGFFEFAGMRTNHDGMRLFVAGILREYGQHSLPNDSKMEESLEYFRNQMPAKPHIEREDILNNRFKAAEDYITACVPNYCEWGQGESGGYRYDNVIEALKIAAGV
jgi:hypothetical protein